MATQVLDYQGFSAMPRSADDPFEVMSSSLQNMRHLMDLLSQKNQILQAPDECSHIPDAAVADLKKGVSLIGRLGHARYRRLPKAGLSTSSAPAVIQIPTSPSPFQSILPSASKNVDQIHARLSSLHEAAKLECVQEKPPHADRYARHGAISMASDVPSGHTHASDICIGGKINERNANGSVHDASTSPVSHRHGHARCVAAVSEQNTQNQACAAFLSPRSSMEPDQGDCALLKTHSSFVSSLSNEERGGTVSSGKPLFSSARPPLPPKKRKVMEKDEESIKRCHKLGRCHCSQKRRKSHSRTEVRVFAVPTNTDPEIGVPDDGYSWCLYGQKLVEGSSNPRSYYKCGSVRGCPARKHVQRDCKDGGVLIVTYGRRHVHPQILKLQV